MALTIVRDDITRMQVDAIVNSTNERLCPGGTGVDASIHAAAGPALAEALQAIGGCAEGSAVLTDAFGISSCRYIIHTVGPRYRDGRHGEGALLRSCYDSILHLAREKGCRSLAIPSISSGAYGFPKDEAYHIATGCIRRFLYELPDDEDMMVYLVLFDQESVDIGRRLEGEIRENIAETYPRAKKEKLRGLFGRTSNRVYPEEDAAAMAPMPMPTTAVGSALSGMAEPAEESDYAAQDLSFAEMCDWWCEQKAISKKHFYADANINKAMFWNMKHHPEQMPKKTNVLACAVGLKLDYDQTQDLLMRAGMTLSRFYELDRIVERYIRSRSYDIDTINGELFERDLALLGTF